MTLPHVVAVLTCSAVALAAGLTPAVAVAPEPQRLALVVTKVVDGKGQPLEGVEVSLIRCYGQRRFTTVPSFTPANPTGVPIEPDRDGCAVISEHSDGEGLATFPNIRVGETRISVARDSTVRYMLRAVKEGYTRGRRVVTPHVARNDYAVVLYRTAGERMFELVEQAQMESEAGDFVAAEVALIQAVAMMRAEITVRDLGTPDALLETMRFLAWVQLSGGNQLAALDTLDEILQLSPDDPFALRTSGVVAVQGRDWPMAEAFFKSYLLFHPDSGDAYLLVGNLNLEIGDNDAAVEHLEAAVELEPELALAYRSLGTAYELAGRLPEAVESFRRYLELAESPDDAVHIRATIAMLRR